MRWLLNLIFIGGLFSYGNTQNSFWTKSDSLHKGRVIGVSAGIGGLWAGSMTALHQVWYKDVPKTKWHSFNDASNWMQMDKVGHFYTAYQLNARCTDLFQWGGIKPSSTILLGSGVSLGYQTTLEFLDAYSADWGFSWSDVVANGIGVGFFALQEGLWHEERILPKFSYHPTTYARVRPEILGSSFNESLLKDYNGQTYWLSISPGKFLKQSAIPKWICFSIGYSVDEKLQGNKDVYVDLHDGTNYRAKREFLLSFDVDFSAIPVKRPWLKTILSQLNYLKVPFPTLLISDRAYFRPFYF